MPADERVKPGAGVLCRTAARSASTIIGEVFRPGRFRCLDGSVFNFILQEGGDYFDGHHCASERVIIESLENGSAPAVDGHALRRAGTGSADRLIENASYADDPPRADCNSGKRRE